MKETTMNDNSRSRRQVSKLVTVLAGLLPCSLLANDSGAFFADSSTKFNLRYRLETVDQTGFDEDATGSTLKARVTWQSGEVSHFKLNAELDHVMALGADDYNDASGESNKTQYPVIADPTGTDLNQLNLMYHKQNLTVIAGRQRILLGNQRFVGGVGWRQNEQTYDGVRAKYKANDLWSFDYSYLFNINRIFGPDGPKKEAEGSFHLFNGHFKLNDTQNLTAFAYLLEYDAASDSLDTYGIDYQGKIQAIALHASMATQSIGDFSAGYFALDGTIGLGKTKVTLGWEQLGSDDGQYGFTTPLATGHKFQGFADKFLGTPANGVNDFYIKVAGNIGKAKLSATYHQLDSVEGSSDYGSEIDLVASYKVHDTTTLVAKYAAYSAEDFATDTNKFWFMANSVF